MDLQGDYGIAMLKYRCGMLHCRRACRPSGVRILAAAKCSRCHCKCHGAPAAKGLPRLTVALRGGISPVMASVVEQRPYAIQTVLTLLSGRILLVFDLKTESEWGEPGPPTADQDHQDQLGPCMCTPRRHRCKFFRADPILRTSDTCFSVTEFRPVPWPEPALLM